MSDRLRKETKKVSSLRVDLAKTELQSDLWEEIVGHKKQEAQAIENEIAILQAKLQGVRDIEKMARAELEKVFTKVIELRKAFEKELEASRDESKKQTA